MSLLFEHSGQPKLVTQWATDFQNLYGDNDSRRHPEELWIATMGHCSVMGEAIRRDNYCELLDAAAHAFCWMCCYINKCNQGRDPFFRIDNTLSEIVGMKFPNICGHCEQAECMCRPLEIDEKKDKSARYSNLFEKWKDFKCGHYELNRWLATFWKIYKGRIHLLTLSSIGFHFLEEAGEAAVAVRQLVQLRGILKEKIAGIDEPFLAKIASIPGLIGEYVAYRNDTVKKTPDWKINYTLKDPLHLRARILEAKMGQLIEFADTFSWYCAILIKVTEILHNAKVTLEDYNIETTLQNVYMKAGTSITCPKCSKDKCECLFFPGGQPE